MITEEFQNTFQQLLPKNLRQDADSKTNIAAPAVFTRIGLLNLAVITLFFIFFLGFYAFIGSRFIEERRSINVPPLITFGLLLWGSASALMYYVFDVRKGIYYLLPGIIIGGSYFLALVSFGLSFAYDGILFHVSFATIMTVLVANAFFASGIFQRYPDLDYFLIGLGTVLIIIFCIGIGTFSAMMIPNSRPVWFEKLLELEFHVIVASLLSVLLMTLLSVLHLRMIEELASKTHSFTDRLHLAANALFIVFILYLSLLMLFGALGKKKID
jgi:hypothetical protein